LPLRKRFRPINCFSTRQRLAGKERGVSCHSSATLGVLREAARREIVDLPTTLAQLQATTFYIDPQLIRSLPQEDASRKRKLSGEQE